MPRDGSGVYSAPPGTKGTPDTTIESAKYNAFVDDLAQDANSARPITAGGTGASSASAARASLGLAIGSDVQAYDADLTTLGGLAKADGNIIVGNGTTWVVESGATARASLGLTIGTHVQAYDADLAAIAGLTSAANKLPYFTGSGTASLADFSPFARTLMDDANGDAAFATMGMSAFWRGRMGDANQEGARTGIGALGVGDFGIGTAYRGAYAPPNFATADLNPTEVGVLVGLPCFYDFASPFGSSVQFPPGFPQTHGVIRGYHNGNNLYGYSWQELTGPSGNRKWLRRATNATTWGPWAEFVHTDNVPADIYKRSNVIGTVTQSGGAPTGALSSGWITTANGWYRRHADGMQECISPILTVPSVAQAVGTGFITATGDRPSWTYPAAFAAGASAPPTLLPAFLGIDACSVNCGNVGATAASLIYLFSTVSRTGLGANVRLYAVGPWY